MAIVQRVDDGSLSISIYLSIAIVHPLDDGNCHRLASMKAVYPFEQAKVLKFNQANDLSWTMDVPLFL